MGDGTNLCDDWIPEARNLFEAAESTAVVLWKGYDNPVDVLAAAAGSIECNEDLMTAANDLTAFVDSLSLDPDQTLTVVAHSFGSIVLGAALAEAGLHVTDVVVAGSPGMTVDALRQLHVQQSPLLLRAGARRRHRRARCLRCGAHLADLRRDQDEHERAGSSPGSRALQLLRAGLGGAGEHGRRGHRPLLADLSATGRPSPRSRAAWSTWFLRMPAVPVCLAGRHYRGPGFRVLVNWCRLVDLSASETGNLVCEVLDEGERALLWIALHVGALPDVWPAHRRFGPSTRRPILRRLAQPTHLIHPARLTHHRDHRPLLVSRPEAGHPGPGGL